MRELKPYLQVYGFSLSDRMLEQFSRYAELLVDWNSRINLTAITDPEEIAVKHFLDSLLALDTGALAQGALVIDVGTGAGFPGIPLKIARPDLQLTLLDSLNKRVNFLQAVSDALGQENSCVHLRAEEGGRDPDHRERYDVAVSRAVAALPVLCEYCLPFVKPGGSFLALKGPGAEDEVASAKRALKLLGGEVEQLLHKTLPGGDRRSIIQIRKISQTPPGYPRTSGKPTKTPL